MQCPRCQAQNEQAAKFCEDCGARLEAVCPSCGQPVGTGKKFCRSCGASLIVADRSRFTSPESYTPKHLAEKILTSKAALEGERKQVTVLFADLKGSMELLADRDPEEARKLLDPVLERMMEAVHRYEGTVNQVMGDGIMALFGAPLAHEDHAVRACYAALRMQEAVHGYTENVRRTHGVDVQIRVGLNSGEVVVRAISNDLRMDYTAVGRTTHLAARMEQLAPPGHTLMTVHTLRMAEGYVHVKPLNRVPVRGLNEPVEVYEMTGLGPVRKPFQASIAAGFNRFVGRAAEFAQLHRALERSAEGHGQVVAVVGEPGVGKSRLFYELAHSDQVVHRWRLFETGGLSYGAAMTYLPVIDLLKAYFKVQDQDDHETVRQKVMRTLLTLDGELQLTLPAIFALLDVPVEDPRWEALDPAQRRRRTLEAVKRLLLRESQVQPVLLVVEDLHWIDPETQAVLDSLVDSVATARLLLLINYRPEYQQRWANKTHYTQLRLDPLLSEDAQVFLRELLGEGENLKPLKRLLIERTEGNPFFLEESVRMFVETGALVGQRGAYQWATSAVRIQVPATVKAILAARLDRLPEMDKHLLQMAAVIGTTIPAPLLQALADLSEDVLHGSLARLQAAEFLYETGLFPDLLYTFKHALTRDVAYESLLKEHRGLLHARIVDVIERRYPDRLVEHVEWLGYHAFLGEVWEKAVQYLRQAGTKAFDRSLNREAVECFEKALEALQHLPDTRHAIERASDVWFDLKGPLIALGEYGRLRQSLNEAQRLAQALGDQRRLGQVLGFQTYSLRQMGDYDRALDAGQRAVALATATGNREGLNEANFFIAQVHFNLGNFRQAIEFYRTLMEALDVDAITKTVERGGPRRALLIRIFPALLGRTQLAVCLAELGDFPEGFYYGEQALRIAEHLDHAYANTAADSGVGRLYLSKGEFDQAIRCLERGLSACQTAEIPELVPFVGAVLGVAYVRSNRVSEAIPLLEKVLETAISMGIMAGRSFFVRALADAYVVGGRIDEGIALAGRALVLSRQQRERAEEASTLRLFGEIYSNLDSPPQQKAEGSYHGALALATELRMRPLVAHCHLGLGKLYCRTGKREQAQEQLTTARSMYREMDMRFWLEQAEAEIVLPG
jgi:class 3 adenylate cyclase/tetratricopeptide (TPR) repeat protein